MNRLVAYIGNDPERLACALYPARSALQVFDGNPVPSRDGARRAKLDDFPVDSLASGPTADWGLGFVQSGDVLLQKRLRSHTAQVDFFHLARDLRADAFLGRATQGEEDRAHAANADLFRFRYWLFGAIGQFGDFSQIRSHLLNSIPDFLRRNIRGHSPSEHLFHLFLSFLHDAGLLETLSPQPEPARRALTESVAFVDRLLAASGAASTKLAMVATNGRCLVALSREHPLQYLEIHGISACQLCQDKLPEEKRDRAIAHSLLRAVIVEAADHPVSLRSGWHRVLDDGALSVGPHASVQIETAR